MRNLLLRIHLIEFRFINLFSRHKVIQDIPCAHSVDVFHGPGQLDVGSFQHLLKPVQFPRPVFHQAFPILHHLPQFSLVFAGNIARSKKSVLHQIRNPLRICHIRLPPRYRFHVLRIDYHRRQFVHFQHIVQRFPIGPRTLHRRHLAVVLFQPIRQFQQFSGRCSSFPDFLLAAILQAGNQNLLVNVNPTANVVNLFHQLRHGSLLISFYYASFCRLCGSTGRGAMREPPSQFGKRAACPKTNRPLPSSLVYSL